MKGGKGPKQQWAKCVVWVCVDGRARIGQRDAEAFLPPRRVVDPGGRDSSSPSVQDRARSYSNRWRQHMVSNVNKGFGDFSSLPSLRP